MTFLGKFLRVTYSSARKNSRTKKTQNGEKRKTNTKSSEENLKMISQTYVSRRSVGFVRNRNIVRHERKSLGSISQIVIVSMLTLVFGLIYVIEGTKATNFDYKISAVESEITEMSARRDDLAVEKARLTSVATAKSSTVAAAMENATVTGYATE